MTTESRFLTRQPPVNVHTKGGTGAGSGAILLDMQNGVWWLMAEGTPVDGTSGTGAGWAGIGSKYTDLTAGKEYINGGTASSPSWKIITSA